MNLLSTIVLFVAKSFSFLGHKFFRIGYMFEGLLPALLSPQQLTDRLNRYYLQSYYSDKSESDETIQDNPHLFKLEPWEIEIFQRYELSSKKILVLGSGWGREAIAFAILKANVVGIDRVEHIMIEADKFAKQADVPVHFLLADIFALPFFTHQFDCAFLSCTMYSAIPGYQRRQEWLRAVTACLNPQGFIVLSFHAKTPYFSKEDRWIEWLNQKLHTLPGANAFHQYGDRCNGGHFFHIFHDEEEIRQELQQPGLEILELNWAEHYAVVSTSKPRPGA